MPSTPIAIVGRAVVLPGAQSPEALWDAVVTGRDLVSTAPEGRWGVGRADILTGDPDRAQDRAWSARGGYVSGFSRVWTPEGFQIPAEQLAGLDPLVHWSLHTARAALADAGISPGADALRRCGAIFGNLGFPSSGMSRFAEGVWLGASPHHGPDAVTKAGIPASDPRNRFMSGLPALLMAKALGLGGAGHTLDAACASSLYAVKLACDRLQDGSTDLMLAGAVNRADDLFIHVGFCALKALSRTGRSRPFHAEADGLVPAEGAGMLVLKRLDDALRDGDVVHGVIRGVGLSNDGRGRGLLAPAEEGQARALRAAYAAAGITPGDIGLLECHATGTPVGDGTELRSTASVFEGAQDLPIGSLKSNMGHLITAAGVAGIVKVLEAMRHEVRPPSLHADVPNPALKGSGLRVLRAAEPWQGVRRAGVSAFGFGGNNAHVVIEALDDRALAIAPPPPASTEPVAIVALSAVAGAAAGAAAFRRAALGDGSMRGPVDAATIGIKGLKFPPKDLQETLGQQLLLLQAAREAVAQTADLPRERTGILVGMGTDAEVARYGARWRLAEWAKRWGVHDPSWLAQARDGFVPVLTSAGVVGTMPNIPANRLSSQLDLGGPGFVVSCEEHSGLVALDLGLRALRQGELDAALVGAVDLSCEPVHRAALQALGPAPTPDDAAVVLVLKRLEDAQAAGDTVLAVFEGDVSFDAAPQDAGLAPTAAGSHAAGALVDVAAAAVQLGHHATPAGAPDLSASPRAVSARTMTGESRSVTVSAPPRAVAPHGTVPQLAVFRADDADALARRLGRNAEGGEGPAACVLVFASAEERSQRLARARRHLQTGTPAGPGVHVRTAPVEGSMAAVFAGAGAAWGGMGQRELRALPELQARLADKGFTRLPHALGWSFTGTASPTPLQKLWGASALCQLHFTLSHDILGLRPTRTLGYSSGETNAVFALGAWSDMDGFITAAEDSGLFTRDIGGAFATVKQAWETDHVDWALWTVLAPVAAVQAALADEPRCHLAIVHTDTDCVIAGDAGACDRVRAALQASLGAPSHRLDYDLAVHVPELGNVGERWRQLHLRPTQGVEGVRFGRNAFADAVDASADAIADGLTGHAVTTLDLRHGVEQAWNDGVRVFVEHGPQGAVSRWIRDILGPERLAQAVVVALDTKAPFVEAPAEGILRPVFEAAAALLAAGRPVDLASLHASLRVSSRTPWADAAPTGPTLTFPAHAPPVALPPRPVAPRLLPEPPVREVQPVPNPNPDAATVTPMPAAPALPPVMEGGAVAADPTHAPPAATPAAAPAAAAPPAPLPMAAAAARPRARAEPQAPSATRSPHPTPRTCSGWAMHTRPTWPTRPEPSSASCRCTSGPSSSSWPKAAACRAPHPPRCSRPTWPTPRRSRRPRSRPRSPSLRRLQRRPPLRSRPGPHPPRPHLLPHHPPQPPCLRRPGRRPLASTGRAQAPPGSHAAPRPSRWASRSPGSS